VDKSSDFVVFSPLFVDFFVDDFSSHWHFQLNTQLAIIVRLHPMTRDNHAN